MDRILKEFYAGKKVLVTGGAGFIGSHLVEKLVEIGAKVTVLDNFSTGFMNNLRSALSHINLQYADITAPYSAHQATIGKEVVFHLAAFISVPNSIKYPQRCALINEVGTANMLTASIKNNVQHFVFSSSAAVYGNKTTICAEDDTPNPQSPYASSKLAGEQLCHQAAHSSDLATTCLRYFNIYGERQNPNGDYAAVVAKFTDCLKNGKPVIIYGDGSQTRDFIQVERVVEANLIAGMQSDHKGKIFNVASGKSINLLALLAQLEKELGINAVSVEHLPTRDGDIKNSSAKTTQLEQLMERAQTPAVLPAPQFFAEQLS